ncbi:MAG: radical SAM protein [Candidatus Cloacimonetes bacterium]|nr:radical SAM protein [Candidatus Cloacimonadota bacterium]
MHYKYLFGPVPSRRLGMSLGVDLVPPKYCSMDCVYCEAGKTSHLIIERREFFPTEDICAEIRDFIEQNKNVDFITFSGAGEPTLHSGIGKIIRFLKKNYPQYKLALLTNSTLLTLPELREEISPIDILIPSLDACSQNVFEMINRPVDNLKIEDIINGLIATRKIFKGKIWLEVFLVPGINDGMEELSRFREVFYDIAADEIQLNGLDRPGTETWVEPMSKERLGEIAEFFSPFNVSVISRKQIESSGSEHKFTLKETIIDTIKRRPCTAEDLVVVTKRPAAEILWLLSEMKKEGSVLTEKQDRGLFYRYIE